MYFQRCIPVAYVCRPTPTIGFRRRSGSMSLPFGRHEIRREGTELFIMNVRPSDEGDYACLGSNIVGQTEEIIQIDVQGIKTASISLCSPTVLCEIQNYILFNLFFLIGL